MADILTDKSRILFKTDTTQNWISIENTFQTTQGELYFYQDAINTKKINHSGETIYRPKLKIGNNSELSTIPFWGNDLITLPYIYAIFYGVPNLVPFSTEANSSTIYNSTGYKEGYRLSSDGTEKQQTNSVITGFMPVTQKDIIRMSGVTWESTIGYCYIGFYDQDYNLLATINKSRDGNENGVSNIRGGTVLNSDKSSHSIVADEKGVYTFNLSYKEGASFSYIRISAEGIGKNMVVTKNELIENPATNILGIARLDYLILD